MAANIKTALTQMAEGKISSQSLVPALHFSCWTEDLDLDEYHALQQISTSGSRDQVIGFGLALLPKYTQVWYKLGCPNTREQWLQQKYGGRLT